MALSESALSELLDALTDRERGVDLVRELAEYLAQELIEVQATQEIGAGRYERSGERVRERLGALEPIGHETEHALLLTLVVGRAELGHHGPHARADALGGASVENLGDRRVQPDRELPHDRGVVDQLDALNRSQGLARIGRAPGEQAGAAGDEHLHGHTRALTTAA